MAQAISTLKGGNRFTRALHHMRLLWQFKGVNPKKGFIAVLYSGDHIDLRHQPRVGEHTWIASDGKQIDSENIESIIDAAAAYGY